MKERMVGNGAEPDGETKNRLQSLARDAIFCNEAVLDKIEGAWSHSGDAMDVALLAFGYKLGLNPSSLRK